MILEVFSNLNDSVILFAPTPQSLSVSSFSHFLKETSAAVGNIPTSQTRAEARIPGHPAM